MIDALAECGSRRCGPRQGAADLAGDRNPIRSRCHEGVSRKGEVCPVALAPTRPPFTCRPNPRTALLGRTGDAPSASRCLLWAPRPNPSGLSFLKPQASAVRVDVYCYPLIWQHSLPRPCRLTALCAAAATATSLSDYPANTTSVPASCVCTVTALFQPYGPHHLVEWRSGVGRGEAGGVQVFYMRLRLAAAIANNAVVSLQFYPAAFLRSGVTSKGGRRGLVGRRGRMESWRGAARPRARLPARGTASRRHVRCGAARQGVRGGPAVGAVAMTTAPDAGAHRLAATRPFALIQLRRSTPARGEEKRYLRLGPLRFPFADRACIVKDRAAHEGGRRGGHRQSVPPAPRQRRPRDIPLHPCWPSGRGAVAAQCGVLRLPLPRYA